MLMTLNILAVCMILFGINSALSELSPVEAVIYICVGVLLLVIRTSYQIIMRMDENIQTITKKLSRIEKKHQCGKQNNKQRK